MKMKSKTKSIIKKIALALAGVAALTAVGFGIKAIVDYTKNDLKTISPSFEVGNLGSDGKYVSDESTLYTKDAFSCAGLQIKLDFDNEINYQVYYYDDLDNFIESTEILSEAYSGGVHDGYARLVIIPTNDEDDKISWKEKVTYPNQMTVKVSKNQETKYYDVFGRRLQLVNDLSACRFYYGYVYEEGGKYLFGDDSNGSKYTVTSRDLLAIKGGSTITATYEKGDNVGKFCAYGLKNTPNGMVCIEDSGTVSSYTFGKDVEYVIIRFFIADKNTSGHFEVIEESFLPSINQYIKITK